MITKCHFDPYGFICSLLALNNLTQIKYLRVYAEEKRMVGRVRIERTTNGLKVRCSTD